LALFALLLLIANPFLNRGPLMFAQPRMGRDCHAFTALKFRTMSEAPQIERSANCPLEVDRITPLGGVLRKMRIDELPQILNVLAGQMSLIGPRPDYYAHACEFVNSVPGYRQRHMVRPGISGLAQTELGYIEGQEATADKVQADLYYIARCNWRLEAWIVWRTLSVILGSKGA
jgi:lipopolysaccharide/colanic/teichoic acid biosynthesis glycosyltransferase